MTIKFITETFHRGLCLHIITISVFPKGIQAYTLIIIKYFINTFLKRLPSLHILRSYMWSRHKCLGIVTSSAIDCNVISTTKIERVRHGDDGYRLSFLSSFMDSLFCVRNKIMYVLSCRTVSALTRVLFWSLFPSCHRNSRNKHQKPSRGHWNSLLLEYIHYSISIIGSNNRFPPCAIYRGIFYN